MLSYTPRTVYPIRNHTYVTKSTQSALNVYKALRVLTQRATRSITRCKARQRARNATQSNVTAAVVCCLQIK